MYQSIYRNFFQFFLPIEEENGIEDADKNDYKQRKNASSVYHGNYDDLPMFKYIKDNVIGSDLIVKGPYGPVKGKLFYYSIYYIFCL